APTRAARGTARSCRGGRISIWCSGKHGPFGTYILGGAMDFGVVLQTNPPASGVIAMMQRAEAAGFSYRWTWDSHVLWQEPFVIYSRILSATSAMTVGPMVTNPGT